MYISCDETQIALSNLVGSAAAELRFSLQDAANGDRAAKLVRDVLAVQWQNNKPMMPKVEVMV